MTAPATRFSLPPGSEASGPPERRGLDRDGVRLLVARTAARGAAGVEHRRFRDIPGLLEPGNLLVVNTSPTLAAALDAALPDGRTVPLHLSAPLSEREWVVEVRAPDNDGPDLGRRAGDLLRLPGGVVLQLAEPYPDGAPLPSRTWRAAVTPPAPAQRLLSRYGRPIAYRYLSARFPLSDRQNVYAAEPRNSGELEGSAEMASAGRPFTTALLVRLISRGVTVAPVVLHAGVSSQELHEPPLPERYRVPAATARLVNSARSAGGRVVAVGTTVVRALESAAGSDGTVRACSGWTDLVLGPDRPARVVDGLVTGLHSPEASHLLLLEAVAGPALVGAAYAAAVSHGDYLWHEFGDSCLLLP